MGWAPFLPLQIDKASLTDMFCFTPQLSTRNVPQMSHVNAVDIL